MPSFNLRIRKVKSYNMQQKKHGFATRAIINGTETFDSVAEEASRNTTLNKYELSAALGIAAEQFARALKNGFAVDLGPIGKIYPTVASKWTETAEEQRKSDLKPSVRYDASAEIKDAVAGCKLTWDNPSDEEIVEEEVVEEEEETETPAPPSSGGAGSNPNPGGSTGGGSELVPDDNNGSSSDDELTAATGITVKWTYNRAAVPEGSLLAKEMIVAPGTIIPASEWPEAHPGFHWNSTPEQMNDSVPYKRPGEWYYVREQPDEEE